MLLKDILRTLIPILIQTRLRVKRYNKWNEFFIVALTPICIYNALTSIENGFEPRYLNGPLNFVYAVGIFVVSMKSLDIALTSRHEIVYVGLNNERHADALLDVGRDLGWEGTFAQLVNLRGVGWKWGLTLDKLPQVYRHNFLKSVLKEVIIHHILSNITVSILVLGMHNHDSLFRALGYDNPSTQAEFFGDIIRTIVLGTAAWSGLSLGYHLLALAVYLIYKLFGLNFNNLSWPALLSHHVFTLDSVSSFWSQHWHFIFRRQFIILGYKPLYNLGSYLGSKNISKCFGIIGAFAVSGLMHEYGIRHAILTADQPSTYPSFTFFLISAFAIIAEYVFHFLTGKKVNGNFGRIWAWSVLILSGIPMTQHWLDKGRLGYIDHPSTWSLSQILTPFGFLFSKNSH